MKKILHITTQLGIIGGIEKYIEQFYLSFCNDYDIHVLSFEVNKVCLDIPKKNIYFIEEAKSNNSMFKIINKIVSRINFISNFSKKNYIDISISHGEIANVFNIISGFFGNTSKIVIIIHNTFNKQTLGFFLYYLCRFIYKYADEIICVSEELAMDVSREINIKKIRVVYNPFDLEKIAKEKDEKIEKDLHNILYNGKKNFCHVSRLSTNKNQSYLIECFYEFNKINKNSQLFIIGEGEEESKLKQKIKELKIDKYVFLIGYKKNIYKYLRHMHYFLFTGFQEGFGRILIDALVCGIPILIHDYKYGAKEIIRDNNDLSECKDIEILENGILTPYMDKEKYIEAMDLMINTKFDKNKIIQNTKKYDIENFKKDWSFILK